MALNFMGLGFSFGAEDKGLKKTIEDVTDGFDGLTESTDNVGKATSTFVDKFNAFANMASSVQLGQLSDTVDSIANKMAGGESEIQDVSAAVETFRTQLTRDYPDIGQEELDALIESQSQYGLGVSTTISQLDNLRKTGVPFETWEGQMAMAGKTAQAFGVEADELMLRMGALSSGFGFSNNQIDDMLNSSISIGQEFGITQESIEGFNKSVDTMNEQLKTVPRLQTPEYMQQLALQTTATAGILHKQLGTDGVTAVETANGAMKKLLEVTTSYDKAQRGVGEYSDFHKQLSSLGADFDRVAASAEQGPVAFVNYMNSLGDELGRGSQQFQNMVDIVGENLGDDFAYILQTGINPALKESLGVMNDFQEGISNGSLNVGDKIGEFAEQTANTIEGLDKVLDSTRENTSKMFGDIALESRKTLRKGLISSAQAVQDKFGEWSKDTGWVGTLTRKFAIFKTEGVMGLLSSFDTLRPIIEGLGLELDQLVPLIGSIGAFSLVAGKGIVLLKGSLLFIAGLSTPILLTVGAFAGLIAIFKSGGGSFSKLFDIWKEGATIGDKLLNVSSNLGQVIAKGFSDLGGIILDFIKSTDWTLVGKTFVDGILSMNSIILDGLFSLIDSLPMVGAWISDVLSNINWVSLSKIVMDGFIELSWMGIKGILILITKIPKILWSLGGISLSILKAVGEIIFGAFVGIFTGLFAVLKDIFMGLFDIITWPFRKAWEFVTELFDFGIVFSGVGDAVISAFSGIGMIIWGFLPSAIQWALSKMGLASIEGGVSSVATVSAEGGIVGGAVSEANALRTENVVNNYNQMSSGSVGNVNIASGEQKVKIEVDDGKFARTIRAVEDDAQVLTGNPI